MASNVKTAMLLTIDPDSDGLKRTTSYRHIRPGYGGTYSFDASTLKHIGTGHCFSGVGVYFKVDADDDNGQVFPDLYDRGKRCFAANIDAWWFHDEGEPPRRNMEHAYILQAVRYRVIEALQRESERSGWTSTKWEMRDSLVLSNAECHGSVGEAVVDGIYEWLETPEEDWTKKDVTKSTGFVVEHTMQSKYFQDPLLSPIEWEPVTEDGDSDIGKPWEIVFQLVFPWEVECDENIVTAPM